VTRTAGVVELKPIFPLLGLGHCCDGRGDRPSLSTTRVMGGQAHPNCQRILGAHRYHVRAFAQGGNIRRQDHAVTLAIGRSWCDGQ